MDSPRRQPKSSSTALTPSRGLAGLSLNSTKKVYGSNSNSSSRPASPTKPTTTAHQRAAARSPTKTPVAASSSSTRRARSKSQSARDGGVGRDVVIAKESTSRPGSPQKTLHRRKSNKTMDRFIPNRDASGAPATSLSSSRPGTPDSLYHRHSASEDHNNNNDDDDNNNNNEDDSPRPSAHNNGPSSAADEEHTLELTAALNLDLNKRILSFSSEPPPASNEHAAMLDKMAKTPKQQQQQRSTLAPAQRRRITTMPSRVLDAPGLVDDYYLNVLDWSSSHQLAIALEHQVYVWDAQSGDVARLCHLGDPDTEEPLDDYVCALKFSDDGSYLAIGTSAGPIQIYDVQAQSRVRTMAGHLSRVPTLSWSGAVLSSGSRDGAIWNSDVRVAQHKQSEMRAHRAEVCGLAWRKDGAGGLSGGGMGLLASGGNDNVVNVWDGRNPSTPKMTKNNHTAAVKAIAWCPWQSSLLATGGGTNDRTLHFWNTTTSARLNSLTTNSQVTSIIWNPHAREFISSHGLPDCQLSVWSYPSLSKVADINQAHDTRVLHSTLSPDGCTVATASSDENLKFWNVFEKPSRRKAEAESDRPRKGGDIGSKRGISVR